MACNRGADAGGPRLRGVDDEGCTNPDVVKSRNSGDDPQTRKVRVCGPRRDQKNGVLNDGDSLYRNDVGC